MKLLFPVAIATLLSIVLSTGCIAQVPSTDPQKTDSQVGSSDPESPKNTGKQTAQKRETPLSLPGFEPFVFRKVSNEELRLHVIKPKGWSSSDHRPCLVYFFGGGWTNGNPNGSMRWPKWAAQHGMVGVAPDYRVFQRFGSSIEDSVSDARAAVRWLQDHATELGIDPAKIVCSGASAGGHLAAWTAINGKGPGSDDPGSPTPQPMGLILFCPATDTKDTGPSVAKARVGGSEARGLACSVTDQMSAKMPPTIVLHGSADPVVPIANSKAFCDKMVANGNRCELVIFEGLKHMYWMSSPEANKQTDQKVEEFLSSLGLIKSPQG